MPTGIANGASGPSKALTPANQVFHRSTRAFIFLQCYNVHWTHFLREGEASTGTRKKNTPTHN